MPPGPPWKLVSPAGVLHVIEDRDALPIFCADESLNKFNIEHLLELRTGNSAWPLHVKFWQPLHLLLFLGRDGLEELVPVLGGPGKGAAKGEAGVDYFLEVVAHARHDMTFTEKNRDKLQQLLVGSYRSNGQLSNKFMGWGLVDAPVHLDGFFGRVQRWRSTSAVLQAIRPKAHAQPHPHPPHPGPAPSLLRCRVFAPHPAARFCAIPAQMARV